MVVIMRLVQNCQHSIRSKSVTTQSARFGLIVIWTIPMTCALMTALMIKTKVMIILIYNVHDNHQEGDD